MCRFFRFQLSHCFTVLALAAFGITANVSSLFAQGYDLVQSPIDAPFHLKAMRANKVKEVREYVKLVPKVPTDDSTEYLTKVLHFEHLPNKSILRTEKLTQYTVDTVTWETRDTLVPDEQVVIFNNEGQTIETYEPTSEYHYYNYWDKQGRTIAQSTYEEGTLLDSTVYFPEWSFPIESRQFYKQFDAEKNSWVTSTTEEDEQDIEVRFDTVQRVRDIINTDEPFDTVVRIYYPDTTLPVREYLFYESSVDENDSVIYTPYVSKDSDVFAQGRKIGHVYKSLGFVQTFLPDREEILYTFDDSPIIRSREITYKDEQGREAMEMSINKYSIYGSSWKKNYYSPNGLLEKIRFQQVLPIDEDFDVVEKVVRYEYKY